MNKQISTLEKIILYFFGSLAIIVILALLIINLADTSHCKYQSENLLLEGKCTQVLFGARQVTPLIVADYDYNNLHKIPELYDQIFTMVEKHGETLGLNQTQKMELVNGLSTNLNFLDKVHNEVY